MVINIALQSINLEFEENKLINSVFFYDMINKFRGNCEKDKFSIIINKRRLNNFSFFPQNIKGIQFYEKDQNNLLYKIDNAICKVFLSENRAEINLINKELLLDTTIITFIKIILILLILKKGGLVLHCSAVYKNNVGYIFCGVSGSGKTTIAKRLYEYKYVILNDEINAVMPEQNNNYIIYPLPFSRHENFKYINNDSALLKKIFIFNLDKTKKKNFNKKLMLLNNVFLPPMSDIYLNMILKNIYKLEENIPIEYIADREKFILEILKS
jgi:hypothetical protein